MQADALALLQALLKLTLQLSQLAQQNPLPEVDVEDCLQRREALLGQLAALPAEARQQQAAQPLLAEIEQQTQACFAHLQAQQAALANEGQQLQTSRHAMGAYQEQERPEAHFIEENR